jgi:hypothetical protein
MRFIDYLPSRTRTIPTRAHFLFLTKAAWLMRLG